MTSATVDAFNHICSLSLLCYFLPSPFNHRFMSRSLSYRPNAFQSAVWSRFSNASSLTVVNHQRKMLIANAGDCFVKFVHFFLFEPKFLTPPPPPPPLPPLSPSLLPSSALFPFFSPSGFTLFIIIYLALFTSFRAILLFPLVSFFAAVF
jgi:hypothetical protein